LFLPWDEDGFAERIDRTIDVFIDQGLIKQVNEDEGGMLARSGGRPTRCSACARSGIRCSKPSSATTSRSRCW
jgi:hypothetical protein